MIHQAHPQAKALRSNWLHKVSAIAALIVGALLVAAATELAITAFQPAVINGWLVLLQLNWLVILFKLHAGFGDVESGLLSQLNLLDLVILALTATMYLGLYAALRKTSRVWAMVALVQPILGMVLFIVTKSAGRSSFMGAELVISVVMLRSQLFDKRIPYIGLISGVLLLAGDLGASMAPSIILAIVMGAGYMLLLIWLFLVGNRLFQLGQDKELV